MHITDRIKLTMSASEAKKLYTYSKSQTSEMEQRNLLADLKQYWYQYTLHVNILSPNCRAYNDQESTHCPPSRNGQ